MRRNLHLEKTLLQGMFLFYLLTPFLATAQADKARQKLDAYFTKHAAGLKVERTDVAEMFITNSYVDKTTGIEHIYAQQRINGLDVIGGVFSLHSSEKVAKEFAANNLVSKNGLTIAGTVSALTAEQAVRKALVEAKHAENTPLVVRESSANKVVYKRSDVSAMDIPVRKVYLPQVKKRRLQLAWEVHLFDAKDRAYWVMYFDAVSGSLISKRDAVVHCRFESPHYETDAFAHLLKKEKEKLETLNKATLHNTNRKPLAPFATANNYKVFPEPIEAPHDGDQQMKSTAGNSLASPDGWHRIAAGPPQPYTWGNNVWAFHDPLPAPLGGAPNQATSAPPTSLTPVTIEPMTFDYTFNPNIEPETMTNRYAAITNLFYWNNLMHDVYYQFGFDEAHRNFQASHVFTAGQRGPAAGAGDPVWAQAQDGGGTNNANMLTLADGVPGSAQMQMYLWTTAAPDELVHISTSTVNPPPPGKKYIAIQGSFPQPAGANNLHTNPTPVTRFVIPQRNPLSTVGDSTQGCSTGQQSIALPTPGVSGQIAVIDRGGCSFVEKVLGAQLGGAVGVIVVNNVPGPPIAMGGTDAPGNLITIPSVMVSMEDGAEIKNAIRNGEVTGQLKRDNPPQPKRDGDFDNAVIAHEYGHGISNRLTGSGFLPLYGSEQGGEGWSDFMGLYMITRTEDLGAPTAQHPNGVLPDKGIGTYVVYQPKSGQGIRPTRYSVTGTPPFTFKDISNPVISIPHGVGYIWCQMLYNMEQNLIDMYGFNNDMYNAATPASIPGPPPTGSGGNNVAMRLVMEGMKLQPEGPTFQQQRDAILAADTLLYNGAHGCAIWKAFAKFGLGFGARSNTNGVGDEVEDFNTAPACLANQTSITMQLKVPTRVLNGGSKTDSIRVRNSFSNTINNVRVVDTVSQFVNITGTNPAATSIVTVGGKKIVTWITSLSGNQEKLFTVTGTVNIPTGGTQLFFDDHEDGPGGWTTVSTNPTADWTISTVKPFSGTNHWYVQNVDVNLPASDHYLQMNQNVMVPSGGAELVFVHFYNTESGFDGGSVEVSNNGGATWTYLPNSKFVKNGYNGIIPVTNTANFTNEWAFTGTSPGYITSIADLSDYAGQNVRIRFRFVQDVATRQDGWYIDDVYIMANRTEITSGVLSQAASDNGFATILDAESDSATTYVFGTGAVLSVQAAELKAKAGRDAISLDWTTIDEANLLKFEVERQAQNERSFRTVAEVTAKGNTRGRTTYRTEDKTAEPNILYSYRLKLVNSDNTVRYTNMVSAKLGDGKSFGFTLMPNPANSTIRLTYNNVPSNGALLRVFDVSGKLMTTWNVGVQNSSSTIIDISTFRNGVYWLELEDNGLKQTQKLIVQH